MALALPRYLRYLPPCDQTCLGNPLAGEIMELNGGFYSKPTFDDTQRLGITVYNYMCNRDQSDTDPVAFKLDNVYDSHTSHAKT